VLQYGRASDLIPDRNPDQGHRDKE